MIAVIVGGVFIASIEVFYFSKLLRKKPFGISMIIKTAFYMVNIIFFTSMAALIGNSLKYEKSIFHEDIIQLYFVLKPIPYEMNRNRTK